MRQRLLSTGRRTHLCSLGKDARPWSCSLIRIVPAPEPASENSQSSWLRRRRSSTPTVFFYFPANESSAWARTDLWESARSIPGVQVLARRFFTTQPGGSCSTGESLPPAGIQETTTAGTQSSRCFKVEVRSGASRRYLACSLRGE
jgi:hypothetical protein